MGIAQTNFYCINKSIMGSKNNSNFDCRAAKLSEEIRLSNATLNREKSAEHNKRSFWVFQNGGWEKIEESCMLDSHLIEHIRGSKKEVSFEWNENYHTSFQEESQCVSDSTKTIKSEKMIHSSQTNGDKGLHRAPAISMVKKNPKCSILYIIMNCVFLMAILFGCVYCKC